MGKSRGETLFSRFFLVVVGEKQIKESSRVKMLGQLLVDGSAVEQCLNKAKLCHAWQQLFLITFILGWGERGTTPPRNIGLYFVNGVTVTNTTLPPHWGRSYAYVVHPQPGTKNLVTCLYDLCNKQKTVTVLVYLL